MAPPSFTFIHRRMSSLASESKVRPSEAAVEPPRRTPTLHGLGPGLRLSSGRLRLVQGGEGRESARLRVDETLEEGAFFQRGEDGDALAPPTSEPELDPPWPPSAKRSAARRVRLRRVVAGVVGVASILAALAAAKAMVPPLRGSLDPTPEPTEPIVVAIGAVDSTPVSIPSVGRGLRAPSNRDHRARAGLERAPRRTPGSQLAGTPASRRASPRSSRR